MTKLKRYTPSQRRFNILFKIWVFVFPSGPVNVYKCTINAGVPYNKHTLQRKYRWNTRN